MLNQIKGLLIDILVLMALQEFNLIQAYMGKKQTKSKGQSTADRYVLPIPPATDNKLPHLQKEVYRRSSSLSHDNQKDQVPLHKFFVSHCTTKSRTEALRV